MSIYLDYNATAPVDERVLTVMVECFRNHFGNPDSRTHDFGEDARQQVELARQQIAHLLGVKKDEVFFTSGATESNNIAILGLKDYAINNGKKHIITTKIEHKAILGAVNQLQNEGFIIDFLEPDSSGRVSVEKLKNLLREDTALVSIMHVNNETGIIQPVDEIGELLDKTGILFHIDATQSCGKLVEEIRNLKFNMMSISAHKMHGPQGVGALILHKKKYRLPPLKPIMFGGNQEHGLRPGTLPVALIAGFGKACEIAAEEYKKNEQHCLEIKKSLLELLDSVGLNYKINGEPKWCVNNTLNVSFGIPSEAVMLSTKKYCSLSNGSACTSQDYSLSHVLQSMKLPQEQIRSAIRISWGYDTDILEFKNDFQKFLQVVKELR